MTARPFFVTGSGTDAGKTYVTAALIRGLRARGLRVDAIKPVLSGFDALRPGDSDTAVLAQALGRDLSPELIQLMTPWRYSAALSPDMAAAREGMVLYRKVGCPRCNRTGYKGRVGIFQLLIMNDELEALAAQNAHRDEIERCAAASGMRSLWDDGIAKAAAGLTSLEELARVVSGG